jgi:nucleotide-binding universal stress UspA family protein
MTTQLPSQGPHIDADLDRPIVVGVAADGRAASAVVWAAEEATRTGRPLRLVTARTDNSDGTASEHDLGGVARRLTLADARTVVQDGRAPRVILDVAAACSAALTVVGRRGMSLARRTMVGGTSLTVVTESTCPVIMVPESWMQPSLCSLPISLGLPPGDLHELPASPDPQTSVIGFAFDRASSMRVPLVVHSAWAIPPLALHNPIEIARCRQRFAEQLTRRLAPWSELYPDVDLTLRSQAVNALDALLEAEAEAQLTVVGRHSETTAPPFGLGSTTRSFIRRAHRPVAVIAP